MMDHGNGTLPTVQRRGRGAAPSPTGTRWNTRKQQYCEKVLEGLSQKDAAIEVGYAPTHASQSACRLMKDPLVQQYLERRRAEIAEQTGYTIERAMTDLERDRELAYRTENATAAARCTELMSKLNGLLVDKRDIRSVGGFTVRIEGIADA
jgi:hypothetical protein